MNNKYWSKEVTKNSKALELEKGVFTLDDPRKIALSLKKSADKAKTSTPYKSAMAMLSFYINRMGKKLPKSQKNILEATKTELRDLYGKMERKNRRIDKANIADYAEFYVE
jgi:hypothetical protein